MQLTKLALLTFLVGLIALFFISSNLEPKLIKISDISGKMMDNYVRIQGEVIKSKASEGFTILTLDDSTDSISVITYQKLNVSGNIEVIGKIKEYKGSLEIEATDIREN